MARPEAAKRMNGATAYLPIMADCHRALGKPQEALKLAKSPSVANFAPEAKAEMTIVEAGARRDLGQLDAALRTLELAPLASKSRAPWVVRLRYAYADTLEAAAETFWPAYQAQFGKIGKERGWPPPTRQQFDAQCSAHGALLVGDPATVAEKIVAEHTALGGIDRLSILLDNAVLTHRQIMRAIELLGTAVAPLVRQAAAKT